MMEITLTKWKSACSQCHSNWQSCLFVPMFPCDGSSCKRVDMHLTFSIGYSADFCELGKRWPVYHLWVWLSPLEQFTQSTAFSLLPSLLRASQSWAETWYYWGFICDLYNLFSLLPANPSLLRAIQAEMRNRLDHGISGREETQEVVIPASRWDACPLLKAFQGWRFHDRLCLFI